MRLFPRTVRFEVTDLVKFELTLGPEPPPPAAEPAEDPAPPQPQGNVFASTQTRPQHDHSATAIGFGHRWW